MNDFSRPEEPDKYIRVDKLDSLMMLLGCFIGRDNAQMLPKIS